MNYSANTISAILKESRVIAVVGLSTNPARDSVEVARYLQDHGYRIVPVNPVHAGQEIQGEKCYATLAEAAQALKAQGQAIDVVDCFRRSDAILPIAQEAIAIGARCLWLQLGVVNPEAEDLARKAGLAVVSNHCIKIEHAYLD